MFMYLHCYFIYFTIKHHVSGSKQKQLFYRIREHSLHSQA